MSPELAKQLFAFLAYGALGLGLALAIIAAIVLLTGNLDAARQKAVSRFMLFSLGLVVIGAATELYKAYIANQQAQRIATLAATLPDSFWDGFIFAQTQREFGAAAPVGQESTDTIKPGEEVIRPVALLQKQCILYFAAVRPPSHVALTVEPASMFHETRKLHGYFQTGEICNPTDTWVSASLKLSADDTEGSQYSIATFDARTTFGTTNLSALQHTKSPSTEPSSATIATSASSTIAVAATETICTGEFEQFCAGPHDYFYGCGTDVDARIKAGICPGSFKVLETNSKGGNHCGYSLYKVTCQPE